MTSLLVRSGDPIFAGRRSAPPLAASAIPAPKIASVGSPNVSTFTSPSPVVVQIDSYQQLTHSATLNIRHELRSRTGRVKAAITETVTRTGGSLVGQVYQYFLSLRADAFEGSAYGQIEGEWWVVPLTELSSPSAGATQWGTHAAGILVHTRGGVPRATPDASGLITSAGAFLPALPAAAVVSEDFHGLNNGAAPYLAAGAVWLPDGRILVVPDNNSANSSMVYDQKTKSYQTALSFSAGGSRCCLAWLANSGGGFSPPGKPRAVSRDKVNGKFYIFRPENGTSFLVTAPAGNGEASSICAVPGALNKVVAIDRLSSSCHILELTSDGTSGHVVTTVALGAVMNCVCPTQIANVVAFCGNSSIRLLNVSTLAVTSVSFSPPSSTFPYVGVQTKGFEILFLNRFQLGYVQVLFNAQTLAVTLIPDTQIEAGMSAKRLPTGQIFVSTNANTPSATMQPAQLIDVQTLVSTRLPGTVRSLGAALAPDGWVYCFANLSGGGASDYRASRYKVFEPVDAASSSVEKFLVESWVN